MFTGINEIELNPATLMKAVQHYFDTVVFKDGVSPKVTNIEANSSGQYDKTFTVTTAVEETKQP